MLQIELRWLMEDVLEVSPASKVPHSCILLHAIVLASPGSGPAETPLARLTVRLCAVADVRLFGQMLAASGSPPAHCNSWKQTSQQSSDALTAKQLL